jgi:hypothetical protein
VKFLSDKALSTGRHWLYSQIKHLAGNKHSSLFRSSVSEGFISLTADKDFREEEEKVLSRNDPTVFSLILFQFLSRKGS